MNPTCNKYTLDIIALKRPTALDKLAETIPKPKGAIPSFGLPKWKVMPLESKIPMVPGPAGAYNFTRCKLGQRLWIPAPDAEFNLSDPYCYEMKMSYDAFHDKHLVPYFSRPNHIRHLIKAGLITENLDAKCSLQDYNMYRKYLRKLHCDSVKKELERRTKWSIEDRAIQYAQEQAEKEVKKLKERERLAELRKAVIKSRKIAEKLKLQKQKEKQQKAEERLRTLIQKQKEERRLRHIKSAARAEFIKEKQKAAADIRRKKIIRTFLEWNRKERIRKRTRQMRLTREREQKRKILEQKWEEKQEFQKKQIEQEQFLLKCVEDQRKEFIETYNAKVKRETERMKRLLEDVKMYIKCYLARRRPGSQERICCEKYLEDDVEENLPPLVTGGKRSAMKQKKDEVKSFQLGKSYGKPPSLRIPQTKTDRAKMIKDTGPQKTKEIMGKMTGVGQKAKTTIRKQKKVGSTVKKYKTSRAEKGSKRRAGRRKKRRRKKGRPKEEIDESEEKPETEAVVQSKSTSKTEISDTPSTSELKDRCRCQIIKDAMKNITT